MAVYYFDTLHNGEEVFDDTGTECDSVIEANAQAQLLVMGLAQEDFSNRSDKDIVCTVRSAERTVRFRTRFSLRSEWEEPSDREMSRLPAVAYRFVR